MDEATFQYQISTDHGHTWNVSAMVGELDALKHVVSVLASSTDRYVPDFYPDRYVVRSRAEGQQGWRWMWIRLP